MSVQIQFGLNALLAVHTANDKSCICNPVIRNAQRNIGGRTFGCVNHHPYALYPDMCAWHEEILYCLCLIPLPPDIQYWMKIA